MMEFLVIEKWLFKWSLRAGVISIGAFMTMSSISYFLYFTIQEASSDFGIYLSQFHISAGVLLITMCAALFYGGLKENRLCLLPFLMLTGSVINIFCFILLTYSLVDPYILLAIFILAPSIYCWMCIYSYYLELDPQRSQYPSNAVISYAAPEPSEPIKYPEVV